MIGSLFQLSPGRKSWAVTKSNTFLYLSYNFFFNSDRLTTFNMNLDLELYLREGARI